MCSLCIFLPAMADEESDRSLKLRTGFVFSFLTKYTNWPDTNSPLKMGVANVCIVGDRQVSALATTLNNQHEQKLTIHDHSVTVNIITSVNESNITSCHLLFIGEASEDNVPAFLSYTKNRPVLTMSTAKGFADQGGVVEINLGNSVGLFEVRASFRINIKAAAADGMDIDAAALQAAAEVIK